MTVPSGDGVFEYAAFISYRHSALDKQWAKWLVNELETYEVPVHLQERGLPKKIGKLYRDEDEAHAGARLGDHISSALRNSRAIIVVCTLNTRGSPWIELELEYFRRLGRGDKIFCLLVEGEPNTCFPQSLLNEAQKSNSELGGPFGLLGIAADVRLRPDVKQSSVTQDAKFRLVSGILGCSFDDLKRRDLERQRRKRQVLGTVLGCVAAAFVAAGSWYWDQTRIKTSYYAHATSYWGEPAGVQPISEADFTRRDMAFMVQTQGGRTVSIQRRGYVASVAYALGLFGAETATRWDVSYESDGDVERILAYDRHGELHQVQDFEVSRSDSTAFIDFRSADGSAAFSSDIEPLLGSRGDSDGATEITRHFLRFSDDGLVSIRMYRNQSRLPKRDQSGFFGYRFEYNSDGLEIVRTVLDLNEEPLQLGDNPTVIRSLRNSEGFIESRQSTLLNGQLASNRRGYAEARYGYDLAGNLHIESFFDSVGLPTHHIDGYHLQRIRFDEAGNTIDRQYFDSQLQPTGLRGEHHRWQGAYDERRNLTWSRFHVLPDAPYASRRGFSVYRARYDVIGRRIEESYFDENDRGILGPNGAHIVRYDYERSGLLVEERYFGIDGQLRRPADGYRHSILRIGYDSSRQRVSERYFDFSSEPTIGPFGFHLWEAERDPERGLLTQTRFFGVNSEPVLNSFGYHMWRAEYDDQGRRISQSYFGTDELPTLLEDGYHQSVNEFDQFGQRIETRNYGVAGEPVLRFGSHFYWRAEYDDRGNRIVEAVFDIEGRPANHANGGYHRLVMVYDALGFEVSRRAFDRTGREID